MDAALAQKSGGRAREQRHNRDEFSPVAIAKYSFWISNRGRMLRKCQYFERCDRDSSSRVLFFENLRKTTRNGTIFSRSNIGGGVHRRVDSSKYFDHTDHFSSQLRVTKKNSANFCISLPRRLSEIHNFSRDSPACNLSKDRRVAHGKIVHWTCSRGSERFAMHTYTPCTRRYGPQFRIRFTLVASYRGTQRPLRKDRRCRSLTRVDY